MGRAAPLDGATARAIAATAGTPTYVYDVDELRACCRRLRAAADPLRMRPFYAAKANSNLDLLRIIRAEGLGVDAVSLGEVVAAHRAGFGPGEITYTANNVGDDELRRVRDMGIFVTVDSLSQLERWARLAPDTEVGIRLNPAIGDGHHRHVITAGPDSKFGIDPVDVREVLEIAMRHRLRIAALHQHLGSGIADHALFQRAMETLLEVAKRIPEVRIVDFGGGFAIPYRSGDRSFDFLDFERAVAPLLADFARERKSPIEFRVQPGRYVVASCGTLLVEVTAIKRGPKHTWVGVDSGLNHLIRPALYGSHHEIANLTNPEAPVERCTVVGNICESGDVFGTDRPLPRAREGDLLAIRDAGAYGMVMASTYNLRPLPAEVLAAEGRVTVSRSRRTVDDLVDGRF